VRHAQ